jgi:hypothetical protein
MAHLVRLGETSLERRGRPAWKELVPKEHGIWAWLALPLVLALCLAPALASLSAGLAVVAGFMAAQGFGKALRGSRQARAPTLAALVVANLLGVLAVSAAARPGGMVATLLGTGFAGFVAMAVVRGRAPRHAAFEVLAIAGFSGLGAAVAVAAGADPARVAAGAMALMAWLVLGLWWVKGALSKVLAHREPWVAGRSVAALAVVASLAVGIGCGVPWVGALPLAYALRVAIHPAPSHAKDARRVGLTELGWGLVIAVLAGVL